MITGCLQTKKLTKTSSLTAIGHSTMEIPRNHQWTDRLHHHQLYALSDQYPEIWPYELTHKKQIVGNGS